MWRSVAVPGGGIRLHDQAEQAHEGEPGQRAPRTFRWFGRRVDWTTGLQVAPDPAGRPWGPSCAIWAELLEKSERKVQFQQDQQASLLVHPWRSKIFSFLYTWLIWFGSVKSLIRLVRLFGKDM